VARTTSTPEPRMAAIARRTAGARMPRSSRMVPSMSQARRRGRGRRSGDGRARASMARLLEVRVRRFGHASTGAPAEGGREKLARPREAPPGGGPAAPDQRVVTRTADPAAKAEAGPPACDAGPRRSGARRRQRAQAITRRPSPSRSGAISADGRWRPHVSQSILRLLQQRRFRSPGSPRAATADTAASRARINRTTSRRLEPASED
jgi:hypothetical protein